MFIFFYPVDNAREFGPDLFNNETPEGRVSLLSDMKDEGENVLLFYVGDQHSNECFPNIQDLVNAYNNEDLDGGFWPVLVDIPYEKMKSIIFNIAYDKWYDQKTNDICRHVNDWGSCQFLCEMTDGTTQRFTSCLSENYDGDIQPSVCCLYNSNYTIEDIVRWKYEKE